MKTKFLLGLTTTPGSDYLAKIGELKQFGITEVAFFPTALNPEERKHFYEIMDTSPLKSIPHVHLRDDMEPWEIEFLQKRFGTQIFNIHCGKDHYCFPWFQQKYAHLCPNTFMENTALVPEEIELSEIGGLCLDFSHWEKFSQLENGQIYHQTLLDRLHNHAVGCAHISAIRTKLFESPAAIQPEKINRIYSCHSFQDLAEFDYVKKYLAYLPALTSLELENSFADQLKAKAYLEKIIA